MRRLYKELDMVRHPENSIEYITEFMDVVGDDVSAYPDDTPSPSTEPAVKC